MKINPQVPQAAVDKSNMKIADPKNSVSSVDQPVVRAPKNGSQGPAPVAGPSVQLSGLAGRLATLQTELSATPEFDSARVEAVKQAIRDGQLRVNPEAIADKLLASVGELLRRPH
jgi:negative regulator of flagellin synthesis FlgM